MSLFKPRTGITSIASGLVASINTFRRSGIVWAGFLGLFLSVAGCTESDILVGERLPVRSVLHTAYVTSENAPLGAAPLNLPKPSSSNLWSHRIGTERYRNPHPTLDNKFALQWSVKIGTGDGRKFRINADPVSAGGVVYTLDSAAQVTATSSDGIRLWANDLTPVKDKIGDAGGGGLAYHKDTLYVTSGYGTLSALDPKTGTVRWVQNLDAGAPGAPTIYEGVVYIMTGNGASIALESDSGRIRWQIDGIADVVGVDTGAAPALTRKFAIFALGSGEVFSVFRKGGLRFWSSIISGKRLGVAAATVNDITSDPVVVGNTVYVGTHAGRIAALDVASGKRLWTAKDGALGPVWPVAGSLFFVSDTNKLMRIRESDGRIFWSVDLPNFTQKNPRRSVRIVGHYGPVLAGGQLIVASDDGVLRVFDPVTGELQRRVSIPDGATSAPIFANGTMYIVSTKGELHSFR